LVLKILTLPRDGDDENDDNEVENEVENIGGKQRECSRECSPILACEWGRMGMECMQRVVLAVLEDLIEVVDDICLLGIQGGGDSKERYSSVGFVGVECLLELDTLHTIAGNNFKASDLLAAHKLFQSSGCSSLKEIHRVATSLFSTLELDSSVLHSLISSIDINLHVVSHTSDNHSVSMSLTMPIAIACTSRLHREGYAACDTNRGERVTYSSFPTGVSCLRLSCCMNILNHYV
jgi:hypothetical protein